MKEVRLSVAPLSVGVPRRAAPTTRRLGHASTRGGPAGMLEISLLHASGDAGNKAAGPRSGLLNRVDHGPLHGLRT